MALIKIKAFDRADQAMRLDTEDGSFELIPAGDSPSEVRRGWFKVVDGDKFGVFASSDGPVFFGPRGLSLLESGKHRARVVDLPEGGKQFELDEGGCQIACVRYSPSAFVNYDNWSSDETLTDFFVWLASSISDVNFYHYHTVSSSGAGPGWLSPS